MKEHIVTTFVRTKNVFKHRLKNLKDYDRVKVYMYEIDKLLGSKSDHRPLLEYLRRERQIDFDSKGNFKAVKQGPIDPRLLERAKRRDKIVIPLTALHLWMRAQLKHVTIVGLPTREIPVYFKAFLDHKHESLAPFFSVDSFSNRVHSPVVNLKGNLRFKIRFYNSRVVSLDVKQMQPTILARVLSDALGSNSFSDAIDKGEDVYVHLQKHAGLPKRDDAKKYLFQLIFGKPSKDIGRMFQGNNDWVDWINNYKSRVEPQNPHHDNPHTNLAWLLQYSEVQVMTGIWNTLKDLNVPFLTIHDELLCREKDKAVASSVMHQELRKHFKYFEVNAKGGY